MTPEVIVLVMSVFYWGVLIGMVIYWLRHWR